MISHHHRCIFVHIPKVAGQSVETFFLNLLGLQWEERAPLLLRPKTIADPEGAPERLAHLTAVQYKQLKYINNDLFDCYFKFSFVRNPYTRAVSLYKHLEFDRWCNFERFTRKELPDLFNTEKRFFVAPQHEYIFSKNYTNKEDSIVNFIGRFEQLQKDFAYLLKILNIKSSNLPHVNVSQKNRSKKKKL